VAESRLAGQATRFRNATLEDTCAGTRLDTARPPAVPYARAIWRVKDQAPPASELESCSHAPNSHARHLLLHTTVFTLHLHILPSFPTVALVSTPNTIDDHHRRPCHRHSFDITCTTAEKGPRPPLKRLTRRAFRSASSDPTIICFGLQQPRDPAAQGENGCHCDVDHTASHSCRAATSTASTSTVVVE
jgi:hypothetical protein